MKASQSARPRLLLYYFRLFAVLGAVPFVIIVVDILLHPFAPSLTPGNGVAERIFFGVLVAPLTLAIAILCIRRAPDNLIGWMLVSFSYGIPVNMIRADLFTQGVEIALANLLVGQFWFAFLTIPLYFPDGQIYPVRASRWVNPLVTFFLIFSMTASTFLSRQIIWGTGSSQLKWPNPLFLFELDYSVVTVPILISLIVAGILVVILRYRGSRELERLQLRWLLFGVLFQGGITILTGWNPPWLDSINIWITSLYTLIIPLSVGIAVLRYRLYDIDLIIRRTLQYGLLTVLLGSVYFGMVVMLGEVFRTIAGQESSLAVVLSTLVIAALFNPLRKRLQGFIDRRFYRQKYDAARALEEFSAAAGREVELEPLTSQLVGVVEKTVSPEEVWVWLKD